MTTALLSPATVQALRQGLAELPRADNHVAGDPVVPEQIVTVPSHRAALDPDRALVVGNRGMGKSFWAHALADTAARNWAAATFPELANMDVRIGFNASDRSDPIAPTTTSIQEALRRDITPDAVWRTVLLRATGADLGALGAPAGTFAETASWVEANGEHVDALLTRVDDDRAHTGRKLVVVFDALDQLAQDWDTTRKLTVALLRRALSVRSYRCLRFKLFMRSDQFEAPRLFEFPDGSKIRSTRVDLKWESNDLYALLFARLEHGVSSDAFKSLSLPPAFDGAGDHAKTVVDALAGEFMGANKKRGRVYTWLPLHLADARGETSPRTFLTAWREAASHAPAPTDRPVDHAGLIEGVRKASEDRLKELEEDYWWIAPALAPLRGQEVPMERSVLEGCWRTSATIEEIRRGSTAPARAPIQLDGAPQPPEASLVDALGTIGVLEIRTNGKINVPDIFRVEAGIKRRGGVKPPARQVRS